MNRDFSFFVVGKIKKEVKITISRNFCDIGSGVWIMSLESIAVEIPDSSNLTFKEVALVTNNVCSSEYGR